MLNEKAVILAKAAHNKIMQQAQAGVYADVHVCSLRVSCADDLQAVINRFCDGLRVVKFSEVDAAIVELNANL